LRNSKVCVSSPTWSPLYSQTANGNTKDPAPNCEVSTTFPEAKQLSVSFRRAVLIHWCSQNFPVSSYPVCRQQNFCILNLGTRKATGRVGRAPIDMGQTTGHTNIQRKSRTEKHWERQIFGHINIQRKSRTEKHRDKYSDRKNIQRNSRTEKYSDTKILKEKESNRETLGQIFGETKIFKETVGQRNIRTNIRTHKYSKEESNRETLGQILGQTKIFKETVGQRNIRTDKQSDTQIFKGRVEQRNTGTNTRTDKNIQRNNRTEKHSDTHIFKERVEQRSIGTNNWTDKKNSKIVGQTNIRTHKYSKNRVEQRKTVTNIRTDKNIQRYSRTEKHSDTQTFGHTNICYLITSIRTLCKIQRNPFAHYF